MGKKTVPIADQIVPRRRVPIRTKLVIDVLPVTDSFKTILGKKQIEETIWNEYVYQRQTFHALSEKYTRSKRLDTGTPSCVLV
jgi:hypothetical protein